MEAKDVKKAEQVLIIKGNEHPEEWNYSYKPFKDDSHYRVADQILAHPFLASLMDRAKKYDELLEQTRNACPECKGTGKVPQYTMPAGIAPIRETRCFTCLGVGKVGEPHPERIAVLDSDQSLPDIENYCQGIQGVTDYSGRMSGYRIGQQGMREANFKRIKRESEK